MSWPRRECSSANLPSFQTWTRQPSNLTSWRHDGPTGGAARSAGADGSMNAGMVLKMG